jgi:hypothetical protein
MFRKFIINVECSERTKMLLSHDFKLNLKKFKLTLRHQKLTDLKSNKDSSESKIGKRYNDLESRVYKNLCHEYVFLFRLLFYVLSEGVYCGVGFQPPLFGLLFTSYPPLFLLFYSSKPKWSVHTLFTFQFLVFEFPIWICHAVKCISFFFAMHRFPLLFAVSFSFVKFFSAKISFSSWLYYLRPITVCNCALKSFLYRTMFYFPSPIPGSLIFILDSIN